MLDKEVVQWDVAEHFEKMTYRNRYCVAGANGLIKLSIPMLHGRDQRSSMTDMGISNIENWQKQHWRTLVSAYNRSPYFEHYAMPLERLFATTYDKLVDFNLASIQWLLEQLGLKYKTEFQTVYQKNYDGQCDLRMMRPGLENMSETDFPAYAQVFSERIGFKPNLSLLDLLFSEGPLTLRWLRDNKDAVIEAVNNFRK